MMKKNAAILAGRFFKEMRFYKTHIETGLFCAGTSRA
jgi:hypothetical protein